MEHHEKLCFLDYRGLKNNLSPWIVSASHVGFPAVPEVPGGSVAYSLVTNGLKGRLVPPSACPNISTVTSFLNVVQFQMFSGCYLKHRVRGTSMSRTCRSVFGEREKFSTRSLPSHLLRALKKSSRKWKPSIRACRVLHSGNRANPKVQLQGLKSCPGH